MRNGKPVFIVEGNDPHWELCACGADYLWGRDITEYGKEWKAYDHEPKQEDDPPPPTVKAIFEDLHCEIQAVYDSDGSEAYRDCQLVAVNLFHSGMTFKVYVKDGAVFDIKRWRFG